MIRFWLFIGVIIVFLQYGCNPNAPTKQPAIEYSIAKPTDFDEEKKQAVDLNNDFELKLWAPGPLLSNAVAISFDNNGVAYVAETQRRKSSDIDIRAHRDWQVDELSLQSIEDTKRFHLEQLAIDKSDENTWQEDFNQDGLHDYRDLEVQSEYIRRIWDGNNDGRADSSSLFADGFNGMLTGVGAGVLYHNDEIFYTAAPDVYRLQDKDKDGRSDSRSIIATGFGIHIAYAGHDMSGLTIGPDGKIYWAIGDLGVNVVDQKGKRWAYPNQGVVARANPDGSDFEIFAHGLRNTQELAFDDYGNLVSVDNDGDHPGEHERFVHIVEGMDAGWRINWQFGKYNNPNEDYKVWTDERLHIPHFPGQAAYIVPPIALAPDGPAGLAYNPGTALDEQWQGYFFTSYFKGSAARSQIQAFKLKPKGASFALADTVQILRGIASTGVAFGPDGALYINDWKDSYSKKPEGRIWRIDVPNRNSERAETQKMLKTQFEEKSIEELKNLLAYPDQRVRLKAQFEIVNRNESNTLIEIAHRNGDELARIHAIWGIGQLIRKQIKIEESLLPLLVDENPEIVAQAAKVIGEISYPGASERLLNLVKHESPRVQFYAIEAIGKIGDPEPFQYLIEVLAAIEDKDPVMRHGIAYALSKMPVEDEIVALKDHVSEFVRIGAVVALRHKKSPKVAVFLKDNSSLVVTEAARAIHDDFSIPDAMPALAQAITNINAKEEAFLRRAINANLRVGGQASAERLIIFANNVSVNEEMRKDALWALGYWTNPPILDRVDGRYRPIKSHNQTVLFEAVKNDIYTLLENKKTEIRIAAATFIGRVKYAAALPDIKKILKNTKEPTELRTAALKAIVNVESSSDAIEFALASNEKPLISTALSLIDKIELPDEKKVAMLGQVLNSGGINEKQIAIKTLTNIDNQAADDVIGMQMDKLINNQLEPALMLDVLNAANTRDSESLKSQEKSYLAGLDKTNELALFQETLFGGNIKKGQNIFVRNSSAQCIRCHAIIGYGGAAGPELTKIAARLSREEILESLILPSAKIAPGYGSVLLEMKDGKSVSGILLEENSQELKLKVGEELMVLSVKEISQKEYLPSGMPSVKEALSKEEIRDLMAFLMTLDGSNLLLSNR